MKRFIKENWKYILILVLALAIRQTKVFAINIVDGESMMPNLRNGQIVLGSSIKNLNRGDIVVASVNKNLVVKRVIGLPGEVIEYRNETLYINGEPYEETYLNPNRNYYSKSQVWSYTVGENQYLILGDNRDNSYDGRVYGPINSDQILEKIYIQL